MPDRERHGHAVLGRQYTNWRENDSGAGGEAFHPSVGGSSGDPQDARPLGVGGGQSIESQATEKYSPQEVQKAPMRARATAQVQKPIDAQLKVMSDALGEIRDFVDELARLNLGELLQPTRNKVQDLKLKAHLTAVLRLLVGPNSVSERAGGLTEEEEAIVLKAMVEMK